MTPIIPSNLLAEIKARFLGAHINIECSWDLYQSGEKSVRWSLYIKGEDIEILQGFNSFEALQRYAYTLIAMAEPRKQYLKFNFN